MKKMLEISTFFGEQTVSSYLFFMIFAVTMAILISMILIIRSGIGIKKGLPVMILAAPLVLMGARMLYVVTHIHYYLAWPQRVWELKLSGFSVLGGLLLATAGCVVYAKFMSVDFWRLADLLTPGLGTGIVLTKIGCFFNGCCFGLKTDLPWAVHFPYESPAHKYYLKQAGESGMFSLAAMIGSPAVHPTQLYEAIGALTATLVAIVILVKKMNAGLAALLAAFIFILTRLITFYFRAPVAMDENPEWFYPLLYGIILIAIVFLIQKRTCVRSK